jgi:hypothetical protein
MKTERVARPSEQSGHVLPFFGRYIKCSSGLEFSKSVLLMAVVAGEPLTYQCGKQKEMGFAE